MAISPFRAQGYAASEQTIAAAASITINVANGMHARITLSATAITGITMTAGQVGQELVVSVIQDATGGRSISGWPANVKLAGGAYTVTATANKRDCLSFMWNATDSVWQEIGRAMNL